MEEPYSYLEELEDFSLARLGRSQGVRGEGEGWQAAEGPGLQPEQVWPEK